MFLTLGFDILVDLVLFCSTKFSKHFVFTMFFVALFFDLVLGPCFLSLLLDICFWVVLFDLVFYLVVCLVFLTICVDPF